MDKQEDRQERLSGTLIENLRARLSGLATLSGTIAAVGVFGIVLGLLISGFVRDLRIWGGVVAGIGIIALIISAIVSYTQVRRTVVSRQGRYGTNTFVMVMALIGILGVINWLTTQNIARVDLTATKQFSLAPKTVEILKNLPEPIQAQAFFLTRGTDTTSDVLRGRVDDFFHEFSRRSSKFTYKFVDWELEPTIAAKFGVNQPFTLVFEGMASGRRQQVVLTGNSPANEQDLLTGILIASGQQQKSIYLLTGHGEKNKDDPTNDSTSGLGFASAALAADNYRVENLDLVAQDSIPADAAIVVIASPAKEAEEKEIKALEEYLKLGGRMVIMVDPETPRGWRDFLRHWGLKATDGQIIDQVRFRSPDVKVPVLLSDQYIQSADTQLVIANLDRTFFPGVIGFEPAEKRMDTITVQPIAFTTPRSWVINDPERTTPQPTDKQGPFAPAVIVKATAPLGERATPGAAEATIVVFGDTDFATNKYFYSFSNGDFFLNTVNWLAGDLDLINIRPKPLVFRELVLTRSEFDFMRYSSWLLLPAVMAVIAGIVWWRRR